MAGDRSCEDPSEARGQRQRKKGHFKSSARWTRNHDDREERDKSDIRLTTTSSNSSTIFILYRHCLWVSHLLTSCRKREAYCRAEGKKNNRIRWKRAQHEQQQQQQKGSARHGCKHNPLWGLEQNSELTDSFVAPAWSFLTYRP